MIFLLLALFRTLLHFLLFGPFFRQIVSVDNRIMGLQDVSIFYPDVEEVETDPPCPSDCFQLWHLIVAASLPSFVALMIGFYALKRTNARFSAMVDSFIQCLERATAFLQSLDAVLGRIRGRGDAAARGGNAGIGPVNATDDSRLAGGHRRSAEVYL